MNKDHDGAVIEKILSRFRVVLGRFSEIKTSVDAFPRKPDLLKVI